jgi:superfamily II DNA or RNA helicase
MLRNYQENATKKVRTSVEKNLLLQMPTGSGKTFTFCQIAKEFFIEHVKKVLVLVHRTELMNQTQKSLGEKCFRIEKGIKQIPTDFDFYVGMVETVARRIENLPDFGLVVIDEAHIGNFKKMPFFTNQNTKVLGVTATPIGSKPLSEQYDLLIEPTDIAQLISEGYLLDCKTYAFASDLVTQQNFKVKKGEYDEKQMQDFYSSEKMVKNVLNAYWDYSAGKKTMVFNVNLKHNDSVYNAFKNEGLNVYSITGETDKNERLKTIKAFKEQKDAILCNVGVLTTGFDEPSTETIILNRATKSLVLYLQMVGRGARPFANKEFFTVLDLGKNTQRHGFFDKQHNWQKFFKEGTKKESDKESAMPVKECPSCGFMQHTRKLICEGCGFDFEEERAAQEKEEKEQKLFMLIKEKPVNIPTEQLFELAEQRGWKPYAILYKIAAHLYNYENKHKPIITEDYINSLALIELKKWCEKYGKKNSQWNKDFILKAINDERQKNREQNSTGNFSIREQLS